jgi:hypothetical protein
MPRPSRAPTAAANASATTTASATTIVDDAGLRDSKRTPQGSDIFQRSAIVNIAIIGPTEDVETYNGTPYEKNTVENLSCANLRKKEKLPYANLQNMGSQQNTVQNSSCTNPENTIIEKLLYDKLRKMGSRPTSPAPSTSSTWPPSDIYHGPDTTASSIAAPTMAALQSPSTPHPLQSQPTSLVMTSQN